MDSGGAVSHQRSHLDAGSQDCCKSKNIYQNICIHMLIQIPGFGINFKPQALEWMCTYTHTHAHTHTLEKKKNVTFENEKNKDLRDERLLQLQNPGFGMGTGRKQGTKKGGKPANNTSPAKMRGEASPSKSRTSDLPLKRGDVKGATEKHLALKSKTLVVCVLQCIAAYCSVLQCVAVCCSVLQCVAACCSVLQCVAACCSVS